MLQQQIKRLGGNMFLLVVISLCVGQVISSCPPTSGIYLMYRGDCYPNGSFFKDVDITFPPLDPFPNADYLHCMLPNSTLNGGEWTKSTGEQVDCDSSYYGNNLQCINTTSPANINLYRPNGAGYSSSEDQLYKCCLPTNCSDPSTNIITANIFWYIQIADFSVELPSDITTFPQQLTLHCITIGDTQYTIIFNYASHQIFNSYCPSGTNCNQEILHSSNYTYDHKVNITWDTETISSGSFSQSASNGDHMYTCNLDVTTPPHLTVVRMSTVTVRVPSFTPSSLTVVNKTATTITVSWMIPNPTDADGYVVNATSDTAGTVTQQVEGGSQNTTTLRGLTIGTTYNISVRAYQDILGPASSTISEQTYPIILSINWTLVSSINELNNTQYHINCLTTDVNATTDVYWLVNGVMKDNSMYTMIDGVIYKSTLLVYPDPLGVSVNVTCISMYGGVNYNQTVILQAPSCTLKKSCEISFVLSIGLSFFITLMIISLSISAAIIVPLILYIIRLKRLMATYNKKESIDDYVVMNSNPIEPHELHRVKPHDDDDDEYVDCQVPAAENVIYIEVI